MLNARKKMLQVKDEVFEEMLEKVLEAATEYMTLEVDCEIEGVFADGGDINEILKELQETCDEARKVGESLANYGFVNLDCFSEFHLDLLNLLTKQKRRICEHYKVTDWVCPRCGHELWKVFLDIETGSPRKNGYECCPICGTEFLL